MVVGNIDNSRPVSMKIAIGSLSGTLRIYYPTRNKYRVEDLILEEKYNDPILQLKLGLFLPLSTNFGLAVLHPRKLCVYELIGHSQEGGGGTSYHTLDKCYEHQLGVDGKHFSAFNMDSGPFGGTPGKEMIIVQSMDGKVQIFEQTAHTFTRQFVDCLYPGPMQYLPTLDAFVTVNTACEAQCFRYPVLVSSNNDIESAPRTGSFGLAAMKSTLMEWSIVLGEACVEMLTGLFSLSVGTNSNRGANDAAELVMVCERHMYLMKESGRIASQKRLERSPQCASSYFNSGDGIDNVIIGFQDSTIHIYNDFNLVWAALTESMPVCISVGSFGDQEGLLVTVDEAGSLSVGYLGTKVPTTIASSSVSRDLDYTKVDEEHRALLQVIRQHQSGAKTEPKDKLILRTQMPRSFDLERGPDVELPQYLVRLPDPVDGSRSGDYLKCCIRIYVAYTGGSQAKNVSVSIKVPSFVHVVPSNCIVKTVKANSTPQLIKAYLYAHGGQFASSLEAEVSATYITASGEPQVATYPFSVPLFMACGLKTASKSATHKFTLDTGGAPIMPTELFSDLLFATQECGLNPSELLGNVDQAIGLQFWTAPQPSEGVMQERAGAATASILVSKTSGRYRVQSDCLPALALVLQEVESRLLSREGDMKTTIRCEDKIPLDEYFSEIGAHFAVRQTLRGIYSDLNDKSHLFRVIQKRLLTRFKEKNATPLGGMDGLMSDTYKQLLILSK